METSLKLIKPGLLAYKGLSNGLSHRFLGTSFILRTSTALTTPKEREEHIKHVRNMLAEELPKPYDGPERDLVNFPRRIRAQETGKVRMGFLPDEWFQFFYKKTGVTGPYLFGTGFVTFMLSKEYYIFEDEFSTGCALLIMLLMTVKKFGPTIRQQLDKMYQEPIDDHNKFVQDSIAQFEKDIASEKLNVWQTEGQKTLMEIKRENVHMQLETEYRKRMMHVYNEVKKRLDYQLAYLNTKRKQEQQHMVDWIVNNVVKSITAQQEKEALQKCIEDLKVLSSSAK